MQVSRFEFNLVLLFVPIFRNSGGGGMHHQPYNMDLDSVATDREAPHEINRQHINDAVFYEQAGYRQEAAMRLA